MNAPGLYNDFASMTADFTTPHFSAGLSVFESPF